ncbi:MAG: polysaccharide pyruvyl transferase family protein [Candidatus Eremiobacteraeota bacterium]|nr:polysaccharide pyruvyl transferase family protein [Candidatus Eremiobacteraeota bacterium]
MTKVIWTCWFQGREHAPPLVERCLRSWERINPDWEFRCLDATTVQRYVDLARIVDLKRQSITAAALSDIVRIMLLHEFGGVWVDATLSCNRPLNDWLPGVMHEGFFAFSAPAPDRVLSSWFLSAEANHPLIAAWFRRTLDYWSGRVQADDYFWFHHLFGDIVAAHDVAAEAWSRVPRVSADAPHALQFGGRMYRPKDEVFDAIDWTTPVFKLRHPLPDGDAAPGSLLDYLLKRDDRRDTPSALAACAAPPSIAAAAAPNEFVSLKVSTENLGDHIQIIAGQRLLSRLGITPARTVDRDDELDSAAALPSGDEPAGILLNGWFKSKHSAWPPHARYAPVLHGFHIRLFQCPPLVSEASIAFFRRHEPIGCRDVYTANLLRSKGVEVFVSNCLSLTYSRRIERPETQTEVFVVSRDERIKEVLAPALDRYTFVSHYTGCHDFAANTAQAERVLDMYRSRAKLVVTTLLHCALPAMAMGIPVVVFYPLNDEAGHASDRERFSSLETMVRVYRFDELDQVDWNPEPVDVGAVKFGVLDSFFKLAARWGTAPPPPIGPIAPAAAASAIAASR